MNESLKELRQEQSVLRQKLLRAKREMARANKPSERKAIQDEINDVLKQTSIVDNRIASLINNAGGVAVSEHAIVRYLERVLKLDINGLKAAILPAGARGAASKLGNCTLPIDNGGGTPFRVRIRGGVVVTVLPAGKGDDDE